VLPASTERRSGAISDELPAKGASSRHLDVEETQFVRRKRVLVAREVPQVLSDLANRHNCSSETVQNFGASLTRKCCKDFEAENFGVAKFDRMSQGHGKKKAIVPQKYRTF
jgi:hypothetical protein